MKPIHIEGIEGVPTVMDWRVWSLFGAFVVVAFFVAPAFLIFAPIMAALLDLAETLNTMSEIERADFVHNDGYLRW